MKRYGLATLLAGLLLVGQRQVVMTGAEFRDLFNGRDLAGWVNVNTAPDTWRVKDGLLISCKAGVGFRLTAMSQELLPTRGGSRTAS